MWVTLAHGIIFIYIVYIYIVLNNIKQYVYIILYWIYVDYVIGY